MGWTRATMILARALAAAIGAGTVTAFTAWRAVGALTRRFAVPRPVAPRLRRVRTGGTAVTRHIAVAATFRMPRRMTVAVARAAAIAICFAVAVTAATLATMTLLTAMFTTRCTRALATLG